MTLIEEKKKENLSRHKRFPKYYRCISSYITRLWSDDNLPLTLKY